MPIWLCDECPRSRFEGEMRDAAMHFAGVLARRHYRNGGYCRVLRANSVGSTSGTYQAFVGVYSKRDDHTSGHHVLFSVYRKKVNHG